MADDLAGLKSALQKERDLNKEIKALSPSDRAAILAGADLHEQFAALLAQREVLANMDKDTLAAERDAALQHAARDTASLMLATEIVAIGGNSATIDLVTCHFADRIRVDTSNRNKVTILTEGGHPALEGTTVRDLALAAKARFPSLFH